MSKDDIINQQKALIEALQKKLNATNQKLNDTNHQLKETQIIVEDQKTQMKLMAEQIALLKSRTFNRRSEQLDKKVPNLFNYDVFNEAEDEAKDVVEPINEQTGEAQVVSFEVKGTKKKNLVNRLNKLAEVEIIHDLNEEEKNCPNCGNTLVRIGETVTYKLKYIPAKLIKEKHVYPTYKCTKCYKDDITTIVKAPNDLAFPKSMASSSLVANIISDKFSRYLPLYRQEKLFRNVGLDISRANLSNWFLAGARMLKPLVDLMYEDILKLDIVHMDETTLSVIKGVSNTSYMWGLFSSKYDTPIKLYFYKDNRRHENAAEILKGFKGYVVSDGYEAYKKVTDCINVNCFAHARRKYAEIIKAFKGEYTSTYCDEALKFIDSLYHIEHELERSGASLDEINDVRHNRSKKVLDDYKKWLDEKYNEVPPKTAIGKAMAYSLNQFNELSNFLLDPRLPLDNNLAERGMKSFVLGRKNFMFCFTENGAEMSSVAYSVVETAIANNLNVYEYLIYVFDELAKSNGSVDNLRKLLPYSLNLPEYLKIK